MMSVAILIGVVLLADQGSQAQTADSAEADAIDPQVVETARKHVLPACRQHRSRAAGLHYQWGLTTTRWNRTATGDVLVEGEPEISEDVLSATLDWLPKQGLCRLVRRKPGAEFVTAVNGDYHFSISKQTGRDAFVIRDGATHDTVRLTEIEWLMADRPGRWIAFETTALFAGAFVTVLPIDELIAGRDGYDLTAASWIEQPNRGRLEWICVEKLVARDLIGNTLWVEFDREAGFLATRTGVVHANGAQNAVRTVTAWNGVGESRFPKTIDYTSSYASGQPFQREVYELPTSPVRSTLTEAQTRLSYYGIPERSLNPSNSRRIFFAANAVAIVIIAGLLLVRRRRHGTRSHAS